MKISVLFQPRDSWITGYLQESWWYRTELKKWNWQIEKNTVIQRVKKEQLDWLIQELQSIWWEHRVLICTSVENRKSELERIESLFFNN